MSYCLRRKLCRRVGGLLKSTIVDKINHVLSGDYPDTGPRGVSSEALKDSSWVFGPAIRRTRVWPFKLNQEVISIKSG